MDKDIRLEQFYEFRKFLNSLPEERKNWASTNRYATGLRVDNCNTAGCLGGWCSVYFRPKDTTISFMFMDAFAITEEESDFVCYGRAWSLYQEPICEYLEDWSEAMRRFNKLISHYEFLEGKHPKPELCIEPVV